MGDLNFGESLGVAGASSLFNFGTSLLSSSIANKRSEQMSKELQKDQANYQRQANLRAMSDKRASLEKAGINLNAESGFAPATAMPTASLQAHKADAPGFDPSMLSAISNSQLAEANSKLASANAAAQNRENKANEEEDMWYKWAFDPEFQNLTYDPAAADGQGGYVLPDVEKVIPKASTRKGVEARELAKQRIESELKHLEFNYTQDDLQQMVANKQIADNEVIQALVKLPKAQYDEVQKKISEMAQHITLMADQSGVLVEEKELKRLEKEYSPKAIVDTLLNNPLDISSWFKTILALAIKKAFGK